MNAGWRYRAGDNPAWARADFDDRAWDTLRPARPRHAQPAPLQTGTGWLRLRFRLGDSLRQRALLLQGGTLGAWELYLNGRLVQRRGGWSADPARVRPYLGPAEPVEVPGTGPAEQVLAVRLAPWQSALFRGLNETPLFALRLLSVPQLRRQEAETAQIKTIYYVVAGIFGLLTLLHWAFFRYNPGRRANLYFTFYALTGALGALGNYYYRTLALPTEAAVLGFRFLVWLLHFIPALWAVRALYALFNFRPGWLYAVLWAGWAALLVVAGLHPFTRVSVFALMTFLALATAEQLRLTARALRQRQRGAWIIGAGFASSLVILLGYLALVATKVPLSALGAYLFYPFVGLLPALGISLFLAREFALDAQLLQLKLREVEQLSAQTLAQEQDKQALLAAQNETLEQQVQQRTQQLQHSLTELKTTQAQLVQKEKMASLGELTAGIAHEMQNPLNFVTNFSDVSTELLDELADEQAKPARDAGLEAALVGDLRQNLQKISEHGQRASSIVRGMLEHSRASTGERQPTDVNALADEYLRLAYQGVRAKDNTFHAALHTDFAPGLPRIEAVAGDLGRVLLNLCANAFYAVQQRQRAGESGYQPTVSVSTRQLGNQVEIQVTDNGPGMPAAVQAKVFQPFFTTKPPGAGTGLGLSLAFDIITQGHGGRLSVESQEGAGATSRVGLPVNGPR